MVHLERDQEMVLSLSYDSVTKGHGGMMAVESTEVTGAEYKISFFKILNIYSR